MWKWLCKILSFLFSKVICHTAITSSVAIFREFVQVGNYLISATGVHFCTNEFRENIYMAADLFILKIMQTEQYI